VISKVAHYNNPHYSRLLFYQLGDNLALDLYPCGAVSEIFESL